MCLRLGLHVLGHLFRYYKVIMYIEQARNNVHSCVLLGWQALLCHPTIIRVTLRGTSDVGLLWTRSLFNKGPQNLKNRNETEKKNSLRFLGTFSLGPQCLILFLHSLGRYAVTLSTICHISNCLEPHSCLHTHTHAYTHTVT